MLLRTIAVSALAMGAAALYAPAGAEEYMHVTPTVAGSMVGGKTLTVNYADLDVSHEAGAKVLLGRIQRAAETVCGPKPILMQISEMAAYRACVNQAMAQGVSSTKQPVVSELFRNSVHYTSEGLTAAH
jgi:UrcA family protein